MEYLKNIPESAKDYGIHKVLTVRALGINWKHRDTEIHLRSPELLEIAQQQLDVQSIYRIRSMQLRYIYHIPRDTNDEVPVDVIVDTMCGTNNNRQLMCGVCKTTYVDFAWLLNPINHDEYIRLCNTANVTLFTLNVSEKNMFNYIRSHNLSIPDKIRNYTLSKLIDKVTTGLSCVIYRENTFDYNTEVLLWVLNSYLYRGYEDGRYTYVRLTTDTPLTTW